MSAWKHTAISTSMCLSLTTLLLTSCSSSSEEAKGGGQNAELIKKIWQCRKEYERGTVDADGLTCRVIYGGDSALADACQPATDKAGNVLYDGSPVAPSSNEWRACFNQIDSSITLDDVKRPELPCDRFREKILAAKSVEEAKRLAEAVGYGAPECATVASKAQWDAVGNSVDSTYQANDMRVEEAARSADASANERRRKALEDFAKMK